MLCSGVKKEKTFDPIIEVKATDGQDIIRKLQDTRRNTVLRFLILLRESDYQKCFYSYRDFLWYKRNNFKGELTIEKYEDCIHLPYNIREPCVPRQLYIMLPKERIFIPSDGFTETYIRSKMRELIQIFIKLNAKTVKMTYYDANTATNNIKIDASLSTPTVQLSETSEIINEDKTVKGYKFEMRFEPNTEPFNVNDFMNDQLYYYLRQESGWQYMIQRRVDYNMTYDKYTYMSNERKLLKGKFVSKLKILDMEAEYDWSKYKDLMVDYEIDYYPYLVKES